MVLRKGLLTGFMLAGMVWAGVPAASPAASVSAGKGVTESLAVNFEIPSKSQPITLPAWPSQGTLFVSLKNAMEELGGQVSWQSVTRKVVVKAPSGNQVEVTLGSPKILFNKQRLVRLHYVPRMNRGTVMVSVDSLAIIWKVLENQSAVYDETTHSFLVGSRPVPAAPVREGQRTESVPAPATVRLKGVVIIDAGHGGKDPGATGPTQLQEKSVVLEIARQVQALLVPLGLKVIMTRKDDTFIPLPQRAEIANSARAQLFVSIHANASPNRKANGTEVFIYNREASSRKAAETARFENQDTNYLEIIKDDLRKSVHEEDSITIGGLMGQDFGKIGITIRQIERAPFYVLAKSYMPAILVETAFISNPEEESKLHNPVFCQKLAGAISAGVEDYFKEKNRK
jgi:N-acetylmuramoyl-L-alanine amidase